jgi:uncharacterized protein (TIRG00374 family)
MHPITKRIMIVLSVLLSLAAFFWIIGNISITDLFSSYQKPRIEYILGFLGASVFIQCALTARWKIILKYQGIKLSFIKATLYRLAGYSISYITPGPRVGGEPVTAALMRKEGIPFGKALSGIAMDKVIETACFGTFFIFGGLLILTQFSLPFATKLILIITLVFFVITIGLFIHRLIHGKYYFTVIFRAIQLHRLSFLKKFEHNVQEFEHLMIDFYHEKKLYFLGVVGMSVVAWVGMYFEYQFLSLILGVPIGISQLFLIISFVGVALLTPVPMALGTQEAGQIGAFAIFGIKKSSALALSLMVRARDLVLTGIGLAVVSYYGLNIGSLWKNASGYENVDIDVGGKTVKVKIKKPVTPEYVMIKPPKK